LFGEAHLIINIDRARIPVDCGSPVRPLSLRTGAGDPVGVLGSSLRFIAIHPRRVSLPPSILVGAGRVLTDQMRKWLFRSGFGLGLVDGVDLVARAVAAPGDMITAASEPA
jgi:hypothetical protein